MEAGGGGGGAVKRVETSIPGGGGGGQLAGGHPNWVAVCQGGIVPGGGTVGVAEAPGGGGCAFAFIHGIICGGLEAPGGGGGGITPGGPGCHAMFGAPIQGGGGIAVRPFAMLGIRGAAFGMGGGIRGLGGNCGSNMLIPDDLRGCMPFVVTVPFVPEFRMNSGGGASPSSAISDKYSSSILVLSPGIGGPPCPGRF